MAPSTTTQRTLDRIWYFQLATFVALGCYAAGIAIYSLAYSYYPYDGYGVKYTLGINTYVVFGTSLAVAAMITQGRKPSTTADEAWGAELSKFSMGNGMYSVCGQFLIWPPGMNANQLRFKWSVYGIGVVL
jgi:hypothetical protein